MCTHSTHDLANPEATLDLGAKLANNMMQPITIYLCGELGSGKTTLVRGFLRRLGVTGAIKSPSYALLESYQVLGSPLGNPAKLMEQLPITQAATPMTLEHPLDIYHFDLYRLRDENDWYSTGFADYFSPQNICLVEWAERATKVLPKPDIHITLSIAGAARRAHLLGHSPLGKQLLSTLT